ncbi:MAG: hypothetical protein ACTSQZ_03330 [Candidatus Thorarchaeota archaeon]
MEKDDPLRKDDEPWKKAVRYAPKKNEDKDIERQPHNLQAIIIRILVDPEFLQELINAGDNPNAVKEMLDANHYLTGLSDIEIRMICDKLAKMDWNELQNIPIREIKKKILSELGIKSRLKGVIVDSWLLDGP